jgi:uncharacterized membrane protein
MRQLAAAVLIAVAVYGCGSSSVTGSGASAPTGGGATDPGSGSGGTDAGSGAADAGSGTVDAGNGATDAGSNGTDAGTGGGGASQLAYSVTDLGIAVPTSIDQRGTVTGVMCASSPCPGSTGATFTVTGGWSPLPVPSGAVRVVPMGIDSGGRVAMNGEFPGGVHSTNSLPYKTSPLEFIHGIVDDNRDPGFGSHLAAVNGAGHLVGSFFDFASPNVSSGSYFYDGALTRIAAAPGQNRSAATAINSHDQVVGWMLVGIEKHVFLWDHGLLRDLGTVSGASTIATGINDSGVITGWGATTPTSGASQAFRWDGQMHALGCPDGTIACEALAINGRGDIVGETLTSILGSEVAFIHRDGVFHLLGDLVQDAPGWHFQLAVSVNDAGQIVGNGSLDGVPHAFLLTPRP